MNQTLSVIASSTAQETGFIMWSPFSGTAALILALVLLAVGASTIIVASRLKKDVALPRIRPWLKVVIVVVWALQILILLRIFKHIVNVDPSAGVTGPVLPITIASAVCAFGLVAYFLRGDGTISAIGSGLAAALAGPMVFELPFVLVVAPVSTTPTNPGASLSIPFLIALFTTLSFLAFSSKSDITRYSLYSLGGMFLVFAVWAFFGFGYPFTPLLFALNGLSKVLGFGVTAMMFKRKKGVNPVASIARAGSGASQATRWNENRRSSGARCVMRRSWGRSVPAGRAPAASYAPCASP